MMSEKVCAKRNSHVFIIYEILRYFYRDDTRAYFVKYLKNNLDLTITKDTISLDTNTLKKFKFKVMMIQLSVGSERNRRMRYFRKMKRWIPTNTVFNWAVWRQQSTKSIQNYEIVILLYFIKQLGLAYLWQSGKNYCSLVRISCLICRTHLTWHHQTFTYYYRFLQNSLNEKDFSRKKISCMFVRRN